MQTLTNHVVKLQVVYNIYIREAGIAQWLEHSICH